MHGFLFNEKIKAFTLAEVLVSLSIIGVIAALTIPVMINNAEKAAYAEGCKKAFVIFSTALDMAKTDGDINSWTFTDEATVTNWNKIKKYLSITKECIGTSGCWSPNVKALNGGAATNFVANGYGSPTISFKLADGMNGAFDIHGESFNVTRPANLGSSLLFVADVNGDRGPNKLGYDIFIYVYDGKDLVPAGDDAGGIGDCKKDGEGRECAARVLREGKINY